MDLFSTPIDLPELADRAGVSIRTVRYYIQQGLLAAPEGRGPGAHYTEEHVERLMFIKRLQREHLPLSEIRRVLEGGGDARTSDPAGGTPAPSARDYIRDVLKGKRLTEGGATVYEDAPRYGSPQTAASPKRSQWERITLARDIELHVRRPLSRAENKQVDRLIDAARDIFTEER